MLATGIERAQMRERGLAHGLLDQLGLMELLAAVSQPPALVGRAR